jgi:ketopantoate reductase
LLSSLLFGSSSLGVYVAYLLHYKGLRLYKCSTVCVCVFGSSSLGVYVAYLLYYKEHRLYQ